MPALRIEEAPAIACVAVCLALAAAAAQAQEEPAGGAEPGERTAVEPAEPSQRSTPGGHVAGREAGEPGEVPDGEQEDAEGDAAAEDVEAERLDHEHQVGLRAGAGVPFVFALRYGDASSAPCSATDDRFCVFVGSGIVDLDASFGVLPDLEIAFMTRIGMIGVEPTQENTVLLGLGFRSYLAPESMLKLFLGVRAILDLTARGRLDASRSWSDVDGGLRGEIGLQLDVVRYLGFYLQIGVNVLFARSLYVSPDLSGGTQVRFP